MYSLMIVSWIKPVNIYKPLETRLISVNVIMCIKYLAVLTFRFNNLIVEKLQSLNTTPRLSISSD